MSLETKCALNFEGVCGMAAGFWDLVELRNEGRLEMAQSDSELASVVAELEKRGWKTPILAKAFYNPRYEFWYFPCAIGAGKLNGNPEKCPYFVEFGHFGETPSYIRRLMRPMNLVPEK